MKLNGSLILKNKLLINSKISHLIPPVASNVKNIDNFYPNKLIGQSIKNLVNSYRESLKLNPVFFSLIQIRTFDKLYMDMFKNNLTINSSELNSYLQNYNKSIDFIKTILSKDSVEAAKSIWDINNF
jgi:hypothetical protein